ncbi:hypothetical protein Tco_0647427 [Tanacetum coccineum]
MVGALMYLTASRPDIVHATCYCARYQAKPTEKHLTAVVISSQAPAGHTKAGLHFNVFSRSRVFSFICVPAAQVYGLRTQLHRLWLHFDKNTYVCGGTQRQQSHLVQSIHIPSYRTSSIESIYHFIKEQVEKGIVELFFVGTEYQLADLFTKALSEDRFKSLVRQLGMRCLTPDELEVLAIESA